MEIDVVTGSFGYTAAGLNILLKRKKQEVVFSKINNSVVRAKPKLKFGLKIRNIFIINGF